jgi:peptide/nickel transport system substrate-binding protein
LPYIDGIAWDLVQDTQVLSLKAMSGELDFRSWWLSTEDYTLYMENREQGDFRVLLWSDTYGANPMVFPNESVKDLALRELFNDVRFRQALSLALNREEINEFAYMGLGIPRQASLVQESAYYSEEWENNYAEHDPDRANELLDELGLTDRDADGYRRRPDGETLAVILEYASIFNNYPDVMELVKAHWEEVGIKVAVTNHQRSLFNERWSSNELQIGTWTQPGLTVLFNNWWFFNTGGDWGALWGEWYSSGGESGEQPPEDMVRLYQIWDEIQLTPDQEQRDALIWEAIDLHIKNLWIIGIVGNLPKIVIVKERMRNVPEKLIFDNSLGCPRNADPEQFFIRA